MTLIKSKIPKWLLNTRHLYYAWRGAVKYNHPSEQLFVIGITGTSGKSSTVYFLRQVLEAAGFTVGSLSTIDFYIAGKNKLNDKKMTMLGKMQIQKYLHEMVEKKCDIAIVETTSEGRIQHRHRFINYDMMVLTNLYPEHIDSHGSFAKYKQAKLDIFTYVSTSTRKDIQGKAGLVRFAGDAGLVKKTAIVNTDHDYAREFLKFPFDRQFTFGLEKTDASSTATSLIATNREVSPKGLRFDVDHETFSAPLYGEYNFSNVLGVIAVAQALGVDQDVVKKAVQSLKPAPGRIECISEAEKFGFTVIVDYAFEPVAIKALYKVVRLLKPARIIHVFGSTGGGRDISRRSTVGEYVGKKADICIVTDEDPYDDDPEEIIHDVANAAMRSGKKEGVDLFQVLDRGEAIQQAIHMAQKGDIVLVTGKGSEQAMVVKGKLVPWDDREEVRKALKN
ncbi:MAG: hypothetical protein COU35_04980 [Candidatus Magasanikbacteria bacterium CG10_big_fil_rev_8_21_14_0_10_47_10]|uniref:UDP-N-acetylmuramoyl-L-alanyl-D-glutamate--2, 6-diaminopimelate ligase n=1 Tax=Candidatus Magasanikbacteria bacterium CG10_big_fil_rev_8_21_14_0_10_47_10 TaxID=1974652 RepID=A0A2H0TPB9_9BACT|nr:MAG: hypothetical protein COU35_04980 [Candidatus Magasanikbacteria bacterium CG10_big_fil_rev_8_21_14_0_10_47_10]